MSRRSWRTQGTRSSGATSRRCCAPSRKPGGVFKFVACEVSDLDEVAAIVEECELADVRIMPEGTDAATVLRRSAALADDVLKRGWSLSTRLHILLWGNRRGV